MNKESKFEYLEYFLDYLGITDYSFISKLDGFLVRRLNSDSQKNLDWDCITFHLEERNKQVFFQNGKYVYKVKIMHSETIIFCTLIWYDKISFGPIDFKRDTSDIDIQFELEYKSDLEIQKWDLYPSISTDFIKYKFKPIEDFLSVSRKYKGSMWKRMGAV